MKIVVTSGYRVGSTWCYNILRELMGVPGGFATDGDIDQQLRRPNDNVIKIHLWRPIFLPEEHIRVVCPFREATSQAASLLKVGRKPRDAAIQLILSQEYEAWLYQHRQWFYDVLLLRYNEIESDPVATATKLAGITGMKIPEKAIKKVAKKWGKEATAKYCASMSGPFDGITFFRKNHITNSKPRDVPETFWSIYNKMRAR